MNEVSDHLMLTYVACFSERKDCLSQWRGYADDRQGISIGFCKKMLESLPKIMHHNLSFSELFMMRISKKNMLIRLLKKFLEIWSIKELDWLG